MLALATSVAVVNLCGRLVTVLLYALAPTLEKVINIDYKGKRKSVVLVLFLEFGYLTPKKFKDSNAIF